MTRLFLAAAVLAGLSQTVAAKTLVFCSEGNPETLIPQSATTTTGMNAVRPMFNNLVEFAPGTTQIVPGLADTWEISPDGRDYRFHLRAGVKFQSNAAFTPTRTLNADDVVFSIARQWKADHPFHAMPGATYDYFSDMGLPDLIEAVDKIDDLTVRIRLSRAEAPFLADVAMPFMVVESAEYADAMAKAKTPERFDREPIGTGPFRFVSYQPNMTLRYAAFADYWRGRQALDSLVFSITPNPAVRLTKLRVGECQVAAFPNPSEAGRIEADPNLVLLRQEGLNVGYLSLNTKLKPFNDVRVRRAMNLLIDKGAIIQAVYDGLGTVATNPIPPTLWSFNRDIPAFRRDPAEAQRLLAEAGYPDGFETELWYMPVSRPYNPNGRRMAEMMQADLAKAGIRLKLVTDEWTAYRAKLQAGVAPMALFGWTGDNGDPDNFLQLLLACTAARPGGNNVAKWCDPAYDKLVTAAKETSDGSERDRLYREAQSVFHQEVPWVPVAYSVVLMAARRTVVGFRMDPLGRHIFEGVDLQ